MGFARAVKTCLVKYGDFSGRASFGEYWWFAVFQLLTVSLFVVYDISWIRQLPPHEAAALSPWSMATVYASCFFIVPTWAAGVRRLHDTDRSGWWLLLLWVPLLGLLVIVLLLLPGHPGRNRFGHRENATAEHTKHEAVADHAMREEAVADLRALRHARMQQNV